MINFPNWFEMTAQHNFEKFVPDGGRALQLGVFTGDATEWLINHNWTVIDVDTWEGSGDEHSNINFDEVARYYDLRFRDNAAVFPVRSTTQDYLCCQQRYDKERFDFIYIDADHHAKSVLEDAVLSYPLLKVGGLMAFDDLRWEAPSGKTLDKPFLAIQAFATIYMDRMEQICGNSQAWFKKIA